MGRSLGRLGSRRRPQTYTPARGDARFLGVLGDAVTDSEDHRPAIDKGGRAALRAIEQHKSESKREYLGRLSQLATTGKLAETTAELLKSKDDRVRMRAIEWVGKVSGWLDDGGPQQTHQHLHLHAEESAMIRRIMGDAGARSRVLDELDRIEEGGGE